MEKKRIVAVLALTMIACFSIMAFAELAQAQDSQAARTTDQRTATRTGVSGALASGPQQSSDGPTKTQMALGIGSVFVMIAVVKWL